MKDADSKNRNNANKKSYFLDDDIDNSSFVVRIRTGNDKLNSSSFGDLEDFFAKLEGIDRAFVEHGSTTIKINHYIRDPYYINGEWTVRVVVELGFCESELEFMPKEILTRLYGYLDKCRKEMFYVMFCAADIRQIDEASTVISGHAEGLSSSLDQTFVPNTARVLRNLVDIMGRSNQTHYKFCYDGNMLKEGALESAHFVRINDGLKEILEEDKDISSEPYEKSLMVVAANFFSRLSRWVFREGSRSTEYYIEDKEWLEDFFAGKVILRPGCNLNVTINVGPVGRFKKVQPYIAKVHGVVEPRDFQMSLEL
jgi:hypothetical protein